MASKPCRTPRPAAFIGIGKTKLLELIRTKRVAVKMLDGRIRVSTDACRAFLNSLRDEYIAGKEHSFRLRCA